MRIKTRMFLVAMAATVMLLMTACSDDTAGTDSGLADSSVDSVRADKDPAADGPLQDASLSDVSSSDTEWIDGGGSDGAASVICNPAKVACKSLPGPCKIGELRAIVNGCWGKCVPIELCDDLPAQPDCNITTGITCKAPVPSCLPSYVPTRENTCYGPCVPIGTCFCTQGGPTEQCPGKAFVCHHGAGRCGPLAP